MPAARACPCILLLLAGMVSAQDAIVLSNPRCRLVVEPGIGRITGFNLTGRANVLWRWHPGSPAVARVGAWINHGGDKVWPAPQEEWPRWQGGSWPPDAALDGSPWTVLERGERQVELQSPESPTYRIVVRRRIVLEERDATATIRTIYRRTAPHPSLVQVWTITQVPLAERVALVRPAASPTAAPTDLAPHWSAGHPLPWTAIDDGIAIVPPGDRRLRAGAAAERIGVDLGDTRFTQASAVHPRGSYHRPGINAVVYAAPAEGFMELEFMGPAGVLPAGATSELAVTWHLDPISPAPTGAAMDREPVPGISSR